jgi:hypothetical protein
MGVVTAQSQIEERAAPKLALYLDGQDVPDPWGHDDEAFAACVAVIESGAARHLR